MLSALLVSERRIESCGWAAVGRAMMVSGVFVRRARGAVQHPGRKSIGTDLQRERPLGGRHEAHRHQRAHGESHQQNADEPLVCTPAKEPASHPLRDPFRRGGSVAPRRRAVQAHKRPYKASADERASRSARNQAFNGIKPATVPRLPHRRCRPANRSSRRTARSTPHPPVHGRTPARSRPPHAGANRLIGFAQCIIAAEYNSHERPNTDDRCTRCTRTPARG